MFFNLEVADRIVVWVYGHAKLVDDYHLVVLVLCLLEEFAFRADGGSCYESDIMAPLRQKLTGNQRIFLRTT